MANSRKREVSKDLEVEWLRDSRGTIRVVGPAWKMVKTSDGERTVGFVKVSNRITMRNARQSGHEIEGRVTIRGKSYSAFTSGGDNPDGGRGMIIVRSGK